MASVKVAVRVRPMNRRWVPAWEGVGGAGVGHPLTREGSGRCHRRGRLGWERVRARLGGGEVSSGCDREARGEEQGRLQPCCRQSSELRRWALAPCVCVWGGCGGASCF